VEQIPLTPPVAPFYSLPPPPLHLIQMLNSFWGYLHLPQEPLEFIQEQVEESQEPQEQVQEPLPVEVEQLCVEEMFVEESEVIIEETVEALADDEVVFLEVVAAPER
jgi:hypothetical protein